MVVFLDLEDDAEPPEQMRTGEHWSMQHGTAGVLRSLSMRRERGVGEADERENPNKEKAITRALGCYPYVRPNSASWMLMTSLWQDYFLNIISY
jgi:hypothetical protein